MYHFKSIPMFSRGGSAGADGRARRGTARNHDANVYAGSALGKIMAAGACFALPPPLSVVLWALFSQDMSKLHAIATSWLGRCALWAAYSWQCALWFAASLRACRCLSLRALHVAHRRHDSMCVDNDDGS
jgi:hypothetical protein